MKPSALTQFTTKTRELEGYELRPYLDTKGIVTIGMGHAVESRAAWLALPLVWIGDQAVATDSEKLSEWAALHSMPIPHEASYYTVTATLTLTDADVTTLFNDDVAELETYARSTFVAYAHFSADAQCGVLSMFYSLGPGGFHGYPRCTAFIRAGNWAGAAGECYMHGCSTARNAWTKACFLAAAAHPDDPDVTH
jgi:GH24 family phage-related lysozyme (muramidase)